MKEQIVKNLLSNYVTRGIGIVLGLLLVPFLIARLGAELFGVTALAESTILFFEVLTISVRVAMSRHAAYFLARGEDEEFREYLSAGRVLLFGSSVAVFIFSSLVSYFFPVLFKIPAGYENQSRILFFLISAGFSLSIPNMVYWSVLYAKQRFDLINLSLSFSLIFRALCLFAVFTVAPDAPGALALYGAVYLAMTLAQNMLVRKWAFKAMPGLNMPPAKKGSPKIPELFSFSLHTSLSRLTSLLYDNTSNVIINVLWGAYANAVYSVGARFPVVARRLFLEPAWTLAPTFTHLAAKGEKDKIEKLLFLYSRIAAVLVFPLGLFACLYSRDLIRLWVGASFDASAIILSLLALSLFLEIPASAFAGINLAYGRVSVPSKVGLAVAVFNLFFSVFLGKGLGLGLKGMALSSALCLALYSGIFTPIYGCRISGLSAGRYYRRTILAPFGWAAAVLLPFAAAAGAWGLAGWGLAASAGAACAAYFAVAYFFIFSAEEKSLLISSCRTLFAS